MVTRKEDTPMRKARRAYEERKKEERREKSSNFQTMIPKALYEEVDVFLKEHNISKVQFIKDAYELLKQRYQKEQKE